MSDSENVDPAAQFLQSARSNSLRSSFSPDPVGTPQPGQTNSEDVSDDGDGESASAGFDTAQNLAYQNMSAFGRTVKRTKHMSTRSVGDFEAFMKASLRLVASCHFIAYLFSGK